MFPNSAPRDPQTVQTGGLGGLRGPYWEMIVYITVEKVDEELLSVDDIQLPSLTWRRKAGRWVLRSGDTIHHVIALLPCLHLDNKGLQTNGFHDAHLMDYQMPVLTRAYLKSVAGRREGGHVCECVFWKHHFQKLKFCETLNQSPSLSIVKSVSTYALDHQTKSHKLKKKKKNRNTKNTFSFLPYYNFADVISRTCESKILIGFSNA